MSPSPIEKDEAVENYNCSQSLIKEYKHLSPGLYCNATWDSFYCWPTTAAGSIVYKPCPVSHFTHKDAKAFRICESDGTWAKNGWTNYSECLGCLDPQSPFYGTCNINGKGEDQQVYITRIIRDITFYGSIISLIFLIMAIYIFTYFKSLKCMRVSIHKNLVSAFILRSFMTIAIAEPAVMGRASSYRRIEWLCKLIISLNIYGTLASVAWMFNEGLYLYSRIVTSVFTSDNMSFWIFHLVGWGLPICFMTVWAFFVDKDQPEDCWRNYSSSSYIWIIGIPMIIALSVNLFFLVNIIRILVLKLRASNYVESTNIKKTVKATVILFPLLGITNLLFFFNPKDQSILENMYLLVNALLQNSQGIFVSILYCFLNGEVRNAIFKKYKNYRLSHSTSDIQKRGTFFNLLQHQPPSRHSQTTQSLLLHTPKYRGRGDSSVGNRLSLSTNLTNVSFAERFSISFSGSKQPLVSRLALNYATPEAQFKKSTPRSSLSNVTLKSISFTNTNTKNKASSHSNYKYNSVLSVKHHRESGKSNFFHKIMTTIPKANQKKSMWHIIPYPGEFIKNNQKKFWKYKKPNTTAIDENKRSRGGIRNNVKKINGQLYKVKKDNDDPSNTSHNNDGTLLYYQETINKTNKTISNKPPPIFVKRPTIFHSFSCDPIFDTTTTISRVFKVMDQEAKSEPPFYASPIKNDNISRELKIHNDEVNQSCHHRQFSNEQEMRHFLENRDFEDEYVDIKTNCGDDKTNGKFRNNNLLIIPNDVHREANSKSKTFSNSNNTNNHLNTQEDRKNCLVYFEIGDES